MPVEVRNFAKLKALADVGGYWSPPDLRLACRLVSALVPAMENSDDSRPFLVNESISGSRHRIFPRAGYRTRLAYARMRVYKACRAVDTAFNEACPVRTVLGDESDAVYEFAACRFRPLKPLLLTRHDEQSSRSLPPLLPRAREHGLRPHPCARPARRPRPVRFRQNRHAVQTSTWLVACVQPTWPVFRDGANRLDSNLDRRQAWNFLVVVFVETLPYPIHRPSFKWRSARDTPHPRHGCLSGFGLVVRGWRLKCKDFEAAGLYAAWPVFQCAANSLGPHDIDAARRYAKEGLIAQRDHDRRAAFKAGVVVAPSAAEGRDCMAIRAMSRII